MTVRISPSRREPSKPVGWIAYRGCGMAALRVADDDNDASNVLARAATTSTNASGTLHAAKGGAAELKIS